MQPAFQQFVDWFQQFVVVSIVLIAAATCAGTWLRSRKRRNTDQKPSEARSSGMQRDRKPANVSR